jgi:hypothetical protein
VSNFSEVPRELGSEQLNSMSLKHSR